MTIAYHFTGPTLRDGRPIPAIGETLVHEGPVALCETGLHASECPFDALRYAPGNMLHKVRCEEIEGRQSDKLVCRSRTILATIDAEFLLRRFAADQALAVAHLWDMPTIRSLTSRGACSGWGTGRSFWAGRGWSRPKHAPRSGWRASPRLGCCRFWRIAQDGGASSCGCLGNMAMSVP